MLVFGWRTAVLLVVSVQVLVLALALGRAVRNRPANRLLALLLVAVVGLLTPFTIGFAGFYDRWPWLSFAPLAISLAIGPLVYGYAFALVRNERPPRLFLHLTPALLQFGYLSVSFLLPLEAKSWWNRHGHEPFVAPLITLATLFGVAFYSVAALKVLARYRVGLGQVVSDEARYAAVWLRRAIVAVIATLAVWCGYQAWSALVSRLSYFDVFGLYLVLSALALYLGIEGWRHAQMAFPDLSAAAAPEPAASVRAAKDWGHLGEQWRSRTRAEAWWRDPEINVATLAAHLGVNVTYLSRALNEGLGMNFATLINGMRAEAVAAELAAGQEEDLLRLALAAGFNSKASFNRAFKARFGVSPSDYRRMQGAESQTSSSPGTLRREET